MRRTFTAIAAVLALTGCSVAGEPPTSDPDKSLSADPTETGASDASGTIDVVSGRPLSDFEDSPSYEWRTRS